MAGSLAGATAQTIIYPMEVRRRDLGRGPTAGWGACNNHFALWGDKHRDSTFASPRLRRRPMITMRLHVQPLRASRFET